MSSAKPITTREDGNSLYPLPPDYAALTGEGQRLARVNACRQWLLPSSLSPEGVRRRVMAYQASLWFFDTYYLWPDDEVDFNPMFYDDEPMMSPHLHWAIAEQWITGRMNATVAPRGSAKSKFNQKDILLRNTTRPAYSFTYATSTHPNARETGECLKRQWQMNPRIYDDWHLEFPNQRITPRRGEGSFSAEYMILNNGSWIRLISSQSKMRGGRPRRFRLDDPEHDPKASTAMSVLREYMQELLFKIVIPMITRPDTGVDWIGTYVSKRHYLWHAMQVEETPEGLRAKDARFNRWSRLHIPAAIENEEGVLESCWKEMWPATVKQRLLMAKDEPRYNDAMSLEEIREAIGSNNFNSEFMGKPGATEGNFFGDLTKEKHGYWYEGADENFVKGKLTKSKARICWYEETPDGKKELKKMGLHTFLLEYSRTFMAGDTSHGHTKTSDPKCVTCMAITPNNDLFVLDMWLRHSQETELVKATFKMADRWHCPSVHAEAIRQGISYYNGLMSIVRTRAVEMAGVAHLPSVSKLNVGMAAKEDKISGLLFRFELGKVKLPLFKREEAPWVHLFNQIEDFNPDVADGGLQHDDAIDTVAMSQFILKGRLSKSHRPGREKKTVKERLIEQDYIDENGIHVGEGLDFSQLTVQDVDEILQAQVENESNRKHYSKI